MIKKKLSYSKLSSFDIHGPQALIIEKTIDNEGIRHGSLVDTLIVDKLLNINKFDEEYIILKFKRPENNHLILANEILQNFKELPTTSEILNILKNLNLWSNIKQEELLLNKINDDNFIGYLKESLLCRSKRGVTLEDYISAKDDRDSILNNKITRSYFKTSKNTSIYLQVPFEKEEEFFIYRGIIDLLKITFIDDSTIEVEIIDIKTGTPKSDKFIESFLKYRYYLQSTIYQRYYKEILRNIDKNLLKKNIILKNFKFIYKSRSEDNPYIFEVSEKWIRAGAKGFTSMNIYKYKGVEQLEEEILYHIKSNQYDYKMEYYVNNGHLKISDDLIVVNDD